jgi:O-acetyl-ADP-ribose deacetylase (regulator of RNase III)
MITYKTGNLLDATVQALVNTVNTVGVMGKGVALQFKTAYPENAKSYTDAVKEGKMKLGEVLIVPVNSMSSVKYIINFPTKAHWRYPSRIAWIKSGLENLRQRLLEYDIKSVALPPLGCGNGGLHWSEVRPLIESALSDLPAEVIVYEPSTEIQKILKKEERTPASRLTPVRAMLLQLLYRYRALGEFTSEFAAEKLGYFLERFGDKQLKLDFQKGVYGPYSGKVRHILYAINGYYLKGYEQKDAKPFEPLELLVEKSSEVKEFLEDNLTAEEKERLDTVSSFIEGFESPYGLELLATVDFLVNENHSLNAEAIKAGLQKWSQRKLGLFKEQHIQLALDQLKKYSKQLYQNIAA